jgi:hypothetical protein
METTGFSSGQQIDRIQTRAVLTAKRTAIAAIHVVLGLVVPLLLFFAVTLTLISEISPAVSLLPSWVFIHRGVVEVAGWAIFTAGSIALGLAVMRWMMRVSKKLCQEAERKLGL